MKRSLFTPHRLRIALVLLLLVTSLLPSRAATWLSAPPLAMVQTAAAYLAYPLTVLSLRLRPPQEARLDMGTASQTEDLLKALTGENLRLKQENEALRQRLRLSTQQRMAGIALVPAEVAFASPDPPRPALTVRLLRPGGVGPDMAVVDDNSDLVGRIAAVSESAGVATVRLVTGLEPEVFIAPPGTTDPAKGCSVRLQPARDGRTLVAQQELRPASDGAPAVIRKGDLASLDDPAWPQEARGYVVGKVVEVRPWPDNPLLYRQIVVRPLVPLGQLLRVSVIVPVAPGATP
jgi:hypothetical protein